MNTGLFIYILTPFVAAVSQLLLKKAADEPNKKGLAFYLNGKVILGYVLFFMCMLLNVWALQTLPLSIAGVLEALGYLYVMLLSSLFLGEKITKRKLVGNLIIVLGIILTIYG